MSVVMPYLSYSVLIAVCVVIGPQFYSMISCNIENFKEFKPVKMSAHC